MVSKSISDDFDAKKDDWDDLADLAVHLAKLANENQRSPDGGARKKLDAMLEKHRTKPNLN